MTIFSKNTSIKLLNIFLTELQQLDMFPCIGSELEFYLMPMDNNYNDNLWQAQKLELDLDIEKEKGQNQFEVRTIHSKDILSTIEQIISLKEIIIKQAAKQHMLADFSAKPILTQPGNAMHIHLHLENSKGENLYVKKENQDVELFMHSIGGLCASMQENMLLFAPYEQAYLRYLGDSLQSPCKICWGGNNRSAAVRIPLDEKVNRRLEHRVSASDSCPFEVINAILFGILKGIKEKITPPEKLHGNAFLEQYDYPLLPRSLGEAVEAFKKSGLNTFN